MQNQSKELQNKTTTNNSCDKNCEPFLVLFNRIIIFLSQPYRFDHKARYVNLKKKYLEFSMRTEKWLL